MGQVQREAGGREVEVRTDGEGRIGSRPTGGQAGGQRKYRFNWEGMCQGKRQAIEGRGGGWTPIRFGTYNIRNGRNGELESVLRGMGQENVDVEVFQDTKLTEGIYMRKSARYKVSKTPAPRRHCKNLCVCFANIIDKK